MKKLFRILLISLSGVAVAPTANAISLGDSVGYEFSANVEASGIGASLLEWSDVSTIVAGPEFDAVFSSPDFGNTVRLIADVNPDSMTIDVTYLNLTSLTIRINTFFDQFNFPAGVVLDAWFIAPGPFSPADIDYNPTAISISTNTPFLLNAFSDVTWQIGYAVPVPAAIWLFGSGLLGLIGVARRKVRA